jgi:hypothetical protein
MFEDIPAAGMAWNVVNTDNSSAAPGHPSGFTEELPAHQHPTATAPALPWLLLLLPSSHYCIFALLKCCLSLLQECTHALALIWGPKAAVE